ncbi:MAG: DUF2339 domain-containing protein [Planctomycetaceae bacterium]
MEAILILMALGALIWFFISPFVTMAQSSRLRALAEDIQKLRDELRNRTSVQAKQLELLSQELRQLKGQGATPPLQSTPSATPEVNAPPEATRPLTSATAAPPSSLHDVFSPVSPTTPTAAQPVVPSEAAASTSLVEALHAEPATVTPVSASAEGTPPVKRDTGDLLRDFLSNREREQTEPKPKPRAEKTPPPAINFSEMDASKWMSWIGAIAVMVGMGYFLKYTIEEQWLGPTGRVALGLIGGMLVFVGAAFGMKKDYRILAEGLAGAAMGILYFSLFAAFQWYELVPQLAAFVGMALVTAMGLSFAGKFHSLSSAILAMLGGFLTPFMLSKGGGNVTSLFTYILILDLGVLVLATFRSWGSLHLLNFFGTVIIWLGWLSNSYVPEDLVITAGWITIFGVLFSLLGIWRHVIRKEASSESDMTLMLLTPVAYFAAIYWLTKPEHSNLHGLLAILVAAYYIVSGSFAYWRNPGNNSVVVTLVGIGLTFVTLAVPLQMKGHWIVIAWAVESLLLIEIGLRYDKPGFRVTGFALLAFVQMHLMMYSMGTLAKPLDFTTGFVRRAWEDPLTLEVEKTYAWGLINGRSMSFIANAVVLAILSWEYRRREKAARFERTESSKKLGLAIPMPSANQVSLILIPLVPIAVLAMGLLETYAFGARAHWSVATHLSMVPIWLSFFAIVSLFAYKQMNDVSTLGGLVRGLYSITAILFLGFLFLNFPDWSDTPSPLWGRTLLNPRGIGFLMAFVSAFVGAAQYLRSAPDNSDDRSMATSLTLAVPFVLLGMCLTETMAFGQRHNWIWYSHASAIGIWLSLFTVGILFASRRLTAQRIPLMYFSRILLIGQTAIVVLLFLGTLGDWNSEVRSGLSLAWNYPFLNPRGICFLLAVWAFLVARKFWKQPVANHYNADDLHGPLITLDQMGMLAYAIGFLMFTIEVYAQGRQRSWGTATSLAITGTWAVLALVTIGVGFVKRSAPVRIMALVVFALTTVKVFLYDVWYLDKPIRVAAFTGLGVALFIGSFLYRRFNNQLKDWIKPMSLLLAVLIPFGLSGPLLAEDTAPDLSTQLSHRFPLEPYSPAANPSEVDASFVRIPLTQEMYAASLRGLHDIRILSVDENGVSTQIPYALVSPVDEPGPPECDLPVLRQTEIGTSTEVIVSDQDVADAIEGFQLKVTSPEPEFVRTLRIFGADQSAPTEWKPLVSDGYIVDRSQKSLRLTDTSIDCPPSQFHFYRFEIENAGQRPLAIKSCTARHARRRVATRVSYPVTAKNEVRIETQTTRAEFSLPGSAPIDRLDFEASGPEEYLRQARLYRIEETSTTPIQSLILFHLPKFATAGTTTITFAAQRSDRYRLEIENGDNPRLRVESARASGIQEYLAVPTKALQEAKHPVALYIGGRLDAPSYDLTRIHTLPDVDRMATLQTLPDSKNARYQQHKPQGAWADRHPQLVWMIVIGAIVGLSAIAITLLKAAGNTPTASEAFEPQTADRV